MVGGQMGLVFSHARGGDPKDPSFRRRAFHALARTAPIERQRPRTIAVDVLGARQNAPKEGA